MADYTPTFDPRLSGVTPSRLMWLVSINRGIVQRGGESSAASACRADHLERELEERWLVHAADVRVHIGPDGSVTAIDAQAAFRSFVGAGR